MYAFAVFDKNADNGAIETILYKIVSFRFFSKIRRMANFRAARKAPGDAGKEGRREGAKYVAKESAMSTAALRKIGNIENYETQLWVLLSEELESGPRRISYDDLARRLRCSRSTISYNMGKLMSSGLIGIKDGKLYLK